MRELVRERPRFGVAPRLEVVEQAVAAVEREDRPHVGRVEDGVLAQRQELVAHQVVAVADFQHRGADAAVPHRSAALGVEAGDPHLGRRVVAAEGLRHAQLAPRPLHHAMSHWGQAPLRHSAASAHSEAQAASRVSATSASSVSASLANFERTVTVNTVASADTSVSR